MIHLSLCGNSLLDGTEIFESEQGISTLNREFCLSNREALRMVLVRHPARRHIMAAGRGRLKTSG
jgi:hypothetical protein